MKPTAECIRVCLLPLRKLRTVVSNLLGDSDLWWDLKIDSLRLMLLDPAQLHAGDGNGAEFRPTSPLVVVLLLHLR